MKFRMRIQAILPVVALLVVAPPLQATNGHFLHGVGAINSAMGGAGVAATGDILGSFYLNPAGLHDGNGTRVALSMELFKADRTISSSVPGFGAGSTRSKSEFVPVPAFAWATAINDKVTVGLGGLGIGGFGVDYPQDNTNPVLAPRPFGFGQIFSNFGLMKVSPALAFAVNDKLQLGFALNVDWATLAVDPMPVASPAADPGPDGQPFTQDDRAFYSSATAADGAFGVGFQAGLIYKATGNLNLGLAYSSKQVFDDFEYNSVYENPNLPNFGQARIITFAMDVPAVYIGGFSYHNDQLMVNGEARYITYSKTAGFDKQGFDQTGAVQGFGWDDIWVLAGGLQLSPSEKVALRGGWNWSQNPISEDVAFFNGPAPAIVQNHLTLGLGFTPFEGVDVNLAYYHVFENSVTGPMYGPTGPIPGSSVTHKMFEDSMIATFTFTPKK
ncbi:MAG: OmpP1/FadL family transporter [Gemmatimonadota bacterium]